MAECQLYSFCKSPSKDPSWACNYTSEERRKACAIYVAYLSGNEHVIKWLGEKEGSS